jgi:hypothetical protein
MNRYKIIFYNHNRFDIPDYYNCLIQAGASGIEECQYDIFNDNPSKRYHYYEYIISCEEEALVLLKLTYGKDIRVILMFDRII